MRRTTRSSPLRPIAIALVVVAAGSLGMSNCSGSTHEPVGQQTFSSPQSKPILLSPDGAFAFVANTTSRSVSIIDLATLAVVSNLEVGLEPVGLALKPDGSELWVANHVSDSVSVIDLALGSPTRWAVVATVQDVDAEGVTRFDEPVGIAFANDSKAYVSLSSRNDVAVVDTASYSVTARIHVTAQEPRALAVRGGLLYVAAFESGNQTELSVCPGGLAPPQCTLDASDLVDFVVQSPNIPGADTRIVVDPQVPDRDLFVYDTSNDNLVEAVSGVGTLLYDVVVSSTGEAFMSQTEARNDVNGLDGQNLDVLENRLFLNQVAHVSCNAGGCGVPGRFELEPLPPAHPARGDALATPYGLALSGDDSILVGTAAGTSRLYTLDAASGAVLGILDLNAGVPTDAGQQIPKGVALWSDPAGAPQTAYVLNTLENTVSVVDVSNPLNPQHLQKIPVGNDPTPDAVRRGRIAFNNAFAASTGTFSCESCHPDAHTDQLLWRIGGPCFFGACSGDDEIRSTMPVRGLKNTLPLHWDGTLGDPFGGTNGAFSFTANVPPSCTLGDADGDHDCFLDLVFGSLSGVMCDQSGACPPGGNLLSVQEQDDMAVFLANVSYPPARGRRADDSVSTLGVQGFSDFFIDRGGLGDLVGVRTCADMDSGCHALPLTADTNSSSLGGFDVPTMRGMTDRWLQFSIGITNAEETLEWVKSPQVLDIGIGPLNAPATVIPFDPSEGFEEDVTFAVAFTVFQPVYGQGPMPMLQMFEEASNGHSGALGRQLTLDATTAQSGSHALADTNAILDDLEAADARGAVNLRAVGRRDAAGTMVPVAYSYRAAEGVYKNSNDAQVFTRAELLAEAEAGTAILTVTAALPQNFGSDDHRQPLLSVATLGNGPLGNPDLPILPQDAPFTLAAVDVRGDAVILVDGLAVAGTLTCVGGTFSPYCDSGFVQFALAGIPPEGLHLLQVQNPDGPLSNEFPLCSASGPLVVCRQIP
jgi:YVTN family beta-propeller protein